MSIQTAMIMPFLGAGLIALAWVNKTDVAGVMPSWIYLPFAIMLLTVTVILGLALRVQEDTKISQFVTEALKWQKVEIANQASVLIEVSARFARLSQYYNQASQRQEWEIDALGVLNEFPMMQSMIWLDAANQVRQAVPANGDPRFIYFDWASDPRLRGAMSEARRGGSPHFSHVVDLSDGKRVILLFSPLRMNRRFQGFIVNTYDVNQLLGVIVAGVPESDWRVDVWDGNQEIYTETQALSPSSRRWMQVADISLPGVKWRVVISPRPRLLASIENKMPQIVLVSGLLLTGLLAWGLHLAQRLQSNAAELRLSTKQLADVRDALDTAALISVTDVRGNITYANDNFSLLSQR